MIRRALTASGRGLNLFALTILEVVLFSWAIVAISLLTAGIGVWLVPDAIAKVRWVAGLSRRKAGDWSQVEIPEPYLPAPAFQKGFIGRIERCRWLLTDPATWRDLLWALVNSAIGGFIALLPAAFLLYGVAGISMPVLWGLFNDNGFQEWYTGIPTINWVTAGLCAPVGVAWLALGLRFGPETLKIHAHWTRVLLAPTPKVELALRVRHLTATRADAVDTQAAELRRIERDLHDGAQARLVAMGMSLGAIEHLLERDPDKARLLLAEARAASATALNELRDLVRGIHPPVLADRGLGDAVKALALDNPLSVEVTAELDGRLEPPVESAAYFAVAEMLANATKHSGAQRVWIDLRYDDGRLRMTVTDDGNGGASLSGGTGLRGIERRIGTFDGILALNSPVGGPTTVTMELPCVLSSQRTSFS
jgi:signal transduction histidine kinase